MDRPKYNNSPIQEAVFEMYPSQPLTKESLELLQPVWKESYPDQKVVEEKNIKIQFSPGGNKVNEQIIGNRLVCRSADGIRLVQLSSLFLAVNQLRPYRGWEESFRDTIKQRVDEFQRKLGPLKMRQVGLRYINKIDIPEVPLVWEKWFQFNLPLPQLAGTQPPQFQMQFNQRIAEECQLAITVVTLPPAQPGVSSLLLDIAVVWAGAPIEPDSLAEYMERVHSPHRLVFEGYLNDNLRRLFN
jgi:uncharacterized protein (TIGR04255 family)